MFPFDDLIMHLYYAVISDLTRKCKIHGLYMYTPWKDQHIGGQANPADFVFAYSAFGSFTFEYGYIS